MKKENNLPFHVEKPTLIVDKERVFSNIRTMAEKAQKSGVRFRPHFKTHQSASVGEWFREFGVYAITVSSVDMARYFARKGWKDITIAFPVNVRELQKINRLAEGTSLNLLVESAEVVSILRERLEYDVQLWIKIDTGYHRTGIDSKDFEKILEIARRIKEAPGFILRGILTHSGHSYDQHSPDAVKAIYRATVDQLHEVKSKLYEQNVREIEISIGDTPSCSVVENFDGVDEIRPGNFVFYDIMQLGIGSCSEQDIALAVACPVVAKHEKRNEIIIYGGAVHLSKEFLNDHADITHFGKIAFWKENGWGAIIDGSYVKSLSQEHGIIKADNITFDTVNIGDILMILPVHSCLTVDLLRNHMTTTGEKLNAAQY